MSQVRGREKSSKGSSIQVLVHPVSQRLGCLCRWLGSTLATKYEQGQAKLYEKVCAMMEDPEVLSVRWGVQDQRWQLQGRQGVNAGRQGCENGEQVEQR